MAQTKDNHWITLAVAMIGAAGVVWAAWLNRPAERAARTEQKCAEVVRASWAKNLKGELLSDEKVLFECLSKTDRGADPSLYADISYLLLLCSRERYLHVASRNPSLGVQGQYSSVEQTRQPSPQCSTYPAKLEAIQVAEVKKFSPEALVAASVRRTCVKNYPWPDGEFLDNVTPERMAEIKDSVNTLLDRLKAHEDNLSAVESSLSQTHEVRLAFAVANGRDPYLVRLYGDLLYVISLRNHSRHDKIISYYHSLGKLYELGPRHAIADEGDEATYFTENTIFNLLSVLYYQAVAAGKSLGAAEVHAALKEYLAQRDALAFGIQLLGDPYSDLMKAAGCREVEARRASNSSN